MTSQAKFAFDISFDAKDMSANELRYCESHMQERTQASFDQGFSKGVADTLSGIHGRNEHHLQQVSEQLSEVIHLKHQTRACLQETIGSICQHMARTLFPVMAEKVALPEIMSFLDALKPQLLKHETVHIYVHPDFVQDLQEKIRSLDITPDVIQLSIQNDDTLAPTDCRVEWQDGGVDSLKKRAFEILDEAVERYKHVPSCLDTKTLNQDLTSEGDTHDH